MAPGMGLNSFFAVVVANIAVIDELRATCSPRSRRRCVIILVEGIVFLDPHPAERPGEDRRVPFPSGVRYGIAPGHRPDADEHRPGLQRRHLCRGQRLRRPFYVMRDFFGALTPQHHQGQHGRCRLPHRWSSPSSPPSSACSSWCILAKKGVEGRRAAGYARFPPSFTGRATRSSCGVQSLCKLSDDGKLCAALRRHGLHHSLQV